MDKTHAAGISLNVRKCIITPMHPAIFLDRDGVIIENRSDYVRNWSQVKILPQALPALAQVASSPYRIVLITNQSGIGRGFIPLETAVDINERLLEIIVQAGGRIDRVYMCPHKPSDQCACRKPEPGMILQAARDLDLDLGNSILIGDALTDIQAGRSAGVGRVALVRTGRGAEQEQAELIADMQPFPIYNNLASALRDLIRSNSQSWVD
jgi:D-glycero-D-manno-heptose 1,7-bisphosphate phosphatase